jgi:hypothetical protein
MENIIGAIIGLAIGFAILLVLVFIFKWLWNITMPEVFGLKELTLWQALRVLILASILFGGHRVVTTETPALDTDVQEMSQR